MFALEVEGLDETNARLDGYPAALQAALGDKAAELAAALADLVKNDKLAGGVLNYRSGALSDFDRRQRLCRRRRLSRLGWIRRRREICGDPGVRRQNERA